MRPRTEILRTHRLYENQELATCTVCGLSEGELTTDCPRVYVSRDDADECYAGNRDYRGSRWVRMPNPTNRSLSRSWHSLRNLPWDGETMTAVEIHEMSQQLGMTEGERPAGTLTITPTDKAD